MFRLPFVGYDIPWIRTKIGPVVMNSTQMLAEPRSLDNLVATNVSNFYLLMKLEDVFCGPNTPTTLHPHTHTLVVSKIS